MEGIQVSTYNTGSQNQISVIKVGGYIDTTTSAEVERALNALIKQKRFQIIIDLGAVDYISSAGWGIFISEIKSIRENGGDLKLVQMIPDVYEIFELLEFHHILDVYDSIQEAVSKFEESKYVEVVPETPQSTQTVPQASSEPVGSVSPKHQTGVEEAEQAKPAPKMPHLPQMDEQPIVSSERNKTIIDKAKLSVEEKIKDVIRNHPEYGAFRISRILNSVDYGFTKVGWFGVRSILKQMGLNSRKKRYEFVKNALR
jgi:anti-sigma B factor antagonist